MRRNVLGGCLLFLIGRLFIQAQITEASVRHNLEVFRKVLPVDIYLETGAYGWSGTLNQALNLTITERMANLRVNNQLWVNRDIFIALSAARDAEIEEKLHTK